jgi:hypothetical protein
MYIGIMFISLNNKLIFMWHVSNFDRLINNNHFTGKLPDFSTSLGPIINLWGSLFLLVYKNENVCPLDNVEVIFMFERTSKI